MLSRRASSSDMIMHAHAVVMCIAFLGLYPLGAILMPLLRKWKVHTIFQTVALSLTWIGFGLGYALKRSSPRVSKSGCHGRQRTCIDSHNRASSTIIPLWGWSSLPCSWYSLSWAFSITGITSNTKLAAGSRMLISRMVTSSFWPDSWTVVWAFGSQNVATRGDRLRMRLWSRSLVSFFSRPEYTRRSRLLGRGRLWRCVPLRKSFEPRRRRQSQAAVRQGLSKTI
jgi:hypothetical protein